MKKYIKPNLNIENLEVKEVIAALSDVTNLGFNKGEATGGDAYNFEDFWN